MIMNSFFFNYQYVKGMDDKNLSQNLDEQTKCQTFSVKPNQLNP